ncbi:MAG: hypothetical protein ACI9W5_000590, partial [Ulvibacter sp.]
EESFRRKESIERLEGQNLSNDLNKNLTKEVKKTAQK